MTDGSSSAAPALRAPPLGPALLLGLALRPLRPVLLQPLFDALAGLILRRHPALLERMAAYADRPVCIDPVDLPFVLLLHPDPACPRLRVLAPAAAVVEACAVIRGPLETLIALAEGRVDGDTLFFSRALVVEGDTEVVVALRNAIDDAGIDLTDDLAAALGPLSGPFRRAVHAGRQVATAMQGGVETLRQAVIAPALQGAAAQDVRLAELEAEVRALRKSARRGPL